MSANSLSSRPRCNYLGARVNVIYYSFVLPVRARRPKFLHPLRVPRVSAFLGARAAAAAAADAAAAAAAPRGLTLYAYARV